MCRSRPNRAWSARAVEQAGIGLTKSLASVAGMPGDLRDMAQAGVDKGAEMFGIQGQDAEERDLQSFVSVRADVSAGDGCDREPDGTGPRAKDDGG